MQRRCLKNVGFSELIILHIYVAIEMEPGFITAEHIKHKKISECSDETINKTPLFLVNQLALTRGELKFSTVGYGMK